MFISNSLQQSGMEPSNSERDSVRERMEKARGLEFGERNGTRGWVIDGLKAPKSWCLLRGVFGEASVSKIGRRCRLVKTALITHRGTYVRKVKYVA